MPAPKLRLQALVGTTAAGKTALGEWLADRLDATIVCADSRQLFREISAGTGKPTPAELAARPHRLFDCLSVGEPPSAGEYARAAAAATREIAGAGREILFVGGSGLYLRALIHGLSAQPGREPELRQHLVEEAAALGIRALHQRLSRLDPERAAQLNPSDTQRVTRALEIVESSGHTAAWWRLQPATPLLDAEWRVVEVTVPATELRKRIEARTREMFDAGLVEETETLIDAGREADLSGLRAVGYDEAIELIHGRMTRSEAEARTSIRTRQLAKRQRTWFRHQLEAVRLGPAGRAIEDVGAEIMAAMGR